MSESVAPQIPLIDNPSAPCAYADEAFGFFINSGVVHITFTTAQVDHRSSPGPIRRVVVARLAMPVQGAQSLAVGLYDFLKKNGLDPAPAPSKDKMQ